MDFPVSHPHGHRLHQEPQVPAVDGGDEDQHGYQPRALNIQLPESAIANDL
jgi:hypothetical protein